MIGRSGGLSVEQCLFLVGPEKLLADLLAGLLFASERAAGGPHHVVGVEMRGFGGLRRTRAGADSGRGRVIIGARLGEPVRRRFA